MYIRISARYKYSRYRDAIHHIELVSNPVYHTRKSRGGRNSNALPIKRCFHVFINRLFTTLQHDATRIVRRFRSKNPCRLRRAGHNRFPFQWNWKGDSLQRPLLLRKRGVVDLKRRARCQTPLLPRKRQRLAQFTSRILRAPRLWQTSRGIVMGLEREKRVPKIGGD